jgi:hypothetical protein
MLSFEKCKECRFLSIIIGGTHTVNQPYLQPACSGVLLVCEITGETLKPKGCVKNKEEDQAEQHEAVHIICESCGGLIGINNKGDVAFSGCDTLSVKDNGSMLKIYCGCKDNPHDHRIRTIKKRKGGW